MGAPISRDLYFAAKQETLTAEMSQARPKRKPRTPRSVAIVAPRNPIDADRLPEKARFQLFLYDRQKRMYTSAAKGWHRIVILRSPREAERFWKEIERVVDEPHVWQE